MSHLKITNGQPEKYSIGQLRRDNPNTSFPKEPTDTLLAEWGVYPYTRPEPPAYNSETQVRSDGSFENVAGMWALGYVVTDRSIADIREGAQVSRMEFCNALAAAGILTDVDAIQGAKGDWPASVASFLDYLTPAQARDIQIEWATASNVHRMHPFVLLLGSWLTITDEQIDALFGIGA